MHLSLSLYRLGRVAGCVLTGPHAENITPLIQTQEESKNMFFNKQNPKMATVTWRNKDN